MTEQAILTLLDALADAGWRSPEEAFGEGHLCRVELDALAAYLADPAEWRATQAADDEADEAEPCGACGEPLDNPADPLRWNGTAVCRACFDAFLHRQAEQYTLQNDKPKPKPWKPEAPERKRQQVLLAGMDCLAGQGDLFPTDGEGAG
jgi:hypothetical protein